MTSTSTTRLTHDVSGWTPLDGDDEDVVFSQDMYSMTAISSTLPLPSLVGSGSEFLTAARSPLDTTPVVQIPQHHPHPSISPLTPRSDIVPLGPLTRLPRAYMAPSSDRRAQRNRSRDPGWIPRPRNAFIIFRCEYSREHLQQNSPHESDDPTKPTNPPAKTLSKRAADAWKQLSPSERDRYKVLADKEREEHAQTYPHYRFRPMRRQPAGSSKIQRAFPVAQSQGAFSVQPLGVPVPPTRVPSVLAPSPANVGGNAQSEEVASRSPRQDTQPSLIQSRRRSSSAPIELLSVPHIVPSHRDRRANSMIEKARIAAMPPPWQVTAPPTFEHSSYDITSEVNLPAEPPALNYDYSMSFFSAPPKVTFQPVFASNENEGSIHVPSPLSSATSSLIGWNGEFGPPSPVTSVQTSISPAEVLLSVNSSTPPLVDDSCSPLWGASVGIPSDAFLSSTVGYDPDPSYGDPERTRALEAYAIGLYDYNLFTDQSPLFPEDLLGGNYEDENAAIIPERSLGI